MRFANNAQDSLRKFTISGALKNALFLSASFLCTLPAAAQNAPTRQQASDRMEEIQVIARRRVENIQTVPVAITAISADKLTRQNYLTDVDILKTISGVGVHSIYRDSTLIAVRGQAGRGAVVPYLNEVPVPNTNVNNPHGIGVGGPAMFYDMEGVQVLKGPQGTLFGKNTTGGAVLYQTRKPTDEFGGSIEASYGNYNSRSLVGVINTPLVSDKLLFRAAAIGVQRDGFTHATSTPSHPNGVDLDNRNAWSARGTLTMKLSDDFENNLMVDYMRNVTDGTSFVLVAYNNAFGGGLIGRLYPLLGQYLADQQARGPRNLGALDNDVGYSAKFWTVSDNMKYNISDNLTIRNIASYTKFTVFYQAQDGDGTPYSIISNHRYDKPDNTTQFTEEFQVQGKSFDNKLDWVAGAFFLHTPAESDYYISSSTFLNARSYNEYRSGNDSKAIYAQGTYDLGSMLEGLKFTAGARYTWDRFFNSVRKSLPAIDTCPASIQATRPRADALCTQEGRGSFHAPTWTVGLDYQINPTSMTYIVSRRGYREGGLNVGSQTIAYGLYKPEYVTDLEVGYKSDWDVGDVAVRTNVALFRQWYKDVQADSLEPDIASVVYVVRNGPHATLSGFEFESMVSLPQGIDLGANVAYLDTDFDFSSLVASDAATFRNQLLQDRPKWKYNLSATYHVPISPDLGELSISAQWDYQSTVGLVKAAHSDFDRQPGYGLLNLSANWDHFMGKPLTVSIFANNVTDKLYATGSYALTNVLGTSALSYGEPTMYGVRIKYAFGGEAH
jgi:iron complex outermembrane receptor protein